MKDVMLDLETFDTKPSAAIVSIGAVRFDVNEPGVLGETLYVNVDLDSNLELGRTVSAATIEWWLDQSSEARQRLVELPVLELPEALSRLSQFIRAGDRVWGNGAGFDNVIVADAYRSCKLAQPWQFWSDMCYRTLKTVFSDVPKPEFNGVKHHALHDAMYQAQHLQGIFAHHIATA